MSLSIDVELAKYADREVLKQISFQLKDGEILAIIGETGAGKTTLAKVIAGIGSLYGLTYKGHVETDRRISYIPQNILESLDPLFTIEYQMREVKNDISLIKEMLGRVGFDDVDRVLRSYPHNLSGGMQQRVLTAMALLEGEILVADEFTSALDKTTKLQVVELFNELNKTMGITIIFITHDIELLRFKGKLLVMHKGKMVEFGDAESIKNKPEHPYMEHLLTSLPREGMHYTKDRFSEINIDPEAACPFVKICQKSNSICFAEEPPLKKRNERMVRCHF